MGQEKRVSKKLLIQCPSEVLVHSQQQDRNKWQKLHQGGRTRIILGKWVELNREQRNIWLETRSQESEEKAEGREEITLQFLCQHLPNAGTWGRAGRSQWPKENTEGRGGRDWLDQGTTMCMWKGNDFDNQLEQIWDLMARKSDQNVKNGKKQQISQDGTWNIMFL